MPRPLTDFENNFRSAETLLKVYRLLESPDGPQTKHNLMQSIREMLMASDDEELILLVNELFLGVVRENADMRPAVFKRESLSMLMRQAIVASCTALDVYLPSLLKTHLPLMIQVKQRNFIPTEKTVKDFLRGFQLGMEEILRVINDPIPEVVLGEMLGDYLKEETLSNSQGVMVSLLFLGVEEPWDRIANQLGQSKDSLIKQFDGLVARRNDIVHHGDRDTRNPDGPLQDIQFSWTDHHVRVVHSVVFACDELVQEQVRLFG